MSAGHAESENQAAAQAPHPPKVTATAGVAPRNTIGRSRRRRRGFVRFGRYGVWAIPLFALAAALAPRSSAAYSTDPRVYARYAAHGRYEILELVPAIVAGFLGVVSVVALGALLSRGRARRLAQIGLILGCIGAGAMLWQVNTLIIRDDRLRHYLLRGEFAKMAFNAQDKGSQAVIVALGGAALLILAWILYGVAVICTAGFSRADGALLIISAPFLYAGGLVLNMIPVLGAFLLLAAGLGIGRSAGKVIRGALPDPAAPHYQPGALRQVLHPAYDFALLPGVVVPRTPPILSWRRSTLPPAEAKRPGDKRPGEKRTSDRKGHRSSTAWTVSRTGSDDVAAPPPPAPASVRNLRPISTRRKTRNDNVGQHGPFRAQEADAASGVSVNTDLSAKANNAPAGSTAGDRTRDRNRDQGRMPDRGGRPGGTNAGPDSGGQPDGPMGPAAGRE